MLQHVYALTLPDKPYMSNKHTQQHSSNGTQPEPTMLLRLGHWLLRQFSNGEVNWYIS